MTAWRRCTLLFSIMLLNALSAGCGAPVATPAPIYLRVAGATAMLPALRELSAAYTSRHSHITVDIQAGASQIGLQALRDGSADVAAISWKGEDEAGQQVAPFVWHAVGRDGIALIIHPQNTLAGASLGRAREIFAGRYALWTDIGGKGGEIQVISREDGSGSRAAFEAGVMAGARVTPLALVMPSSSAVVDWVAAHPNAIGYVSMAHITTTVRVLRLGGVLPSPRSVERDVYPLTSTLYLVTRQPAGRAVQDFVQFCLSPAGQAILGKYHGRAP